MGEGGGDGEREGESCRRARRRNRVEDGWGRFGRRCRMRVRSGLSRERKRRGSRVSRLKGFGKELKKGRKIDWKWFRACGTSLRRMLRGRDDGDRLVVEERESCG